MVLRVSIQLAAMCARAALDGRINIATPVSTYTTRAGNTWICIAKCESLSNKIRITSVKQMIKYYTCESVKVV